MLKPDWIKVKLPQSEGYKYVRGVLKKRKLNTVCQEALCPNIEECWEQHAATFMIMGNICTRNCKFCNIKTGQPIALDKDEPENIARAVSELKLKYVVITSVTRDDLDDFGANHFAKTIREIKKQSAKTKVEVLIPDFNGDLDSLKKVLDAKPDVVGHNLEVVPRLYSIARDPFFCHPDRASSGERAEGSLDSAPEGLARDDNYGDYQTSLNILNNIKNIPSKTGIMIGLGETKKEIVDLMRDCAKNNVQIFTIGQYLQPSKNNLPVKKYYHPDEFDELAEIGKNLGIKKVIAGPLVRSSYHAGKY